MMWTGPHGWLIGALVLVLLQSLAMAGLFIRSQRDKAAEKLLAERRDEQRRQLDAAREHRRQYEESLQLLLELNERAQHLTERQICDLALDIAVRLTRSEIGYLHLLNDEQDTISLCTWNVEALKHCMRPGERHARLDDAGIWADYARQRHVVIHNDHQHMADKQTCPAHLRLVRHMSAPVLDGDHVRMIVGVGNKAADYVEADGRQLQLVTNEVGEIVMRRRAEDALKESEARFRFIADQSPGMTWVADENRQCVWVNKTWLAFTGRSMAQDLGRGWMEIIHPDDLEAGLAISTNHFHERTSFVREFRIRRHDGHYCWMLDTSQPRLDGHGVFKGYVGNCLDITERKQAELERELFQTFFSVALDMACIAGADGYFKKVNSTFIKVLGYAEEELLGRPFMEFIVPEDRQATREEIDKLGPDYVTVDVENRYRCKDGTIRLLSWRAFADRHTQLIYATARDITDQRASENQLAKLWLAVEQTSHSIIITDVNGCIEYVNRAFSEVSGYRQEEILGRNPKLLQSGLTPALTYEQMWNSLLRGDIWQGEFHNKRKNGELYIESVRVSPVRQSDGRITHYLAIKEDVTEYRRTIDAILQSRLLLQRVIDSTPDWIIVKDREHRFMLVNQSFASAFNQRPDSMIGCYDTDFIPVELRVANPDRGMRGLHDDEAIFNGQTIHNRHEKIVLESGETRIFDTFKGPLLDASLNIYGILCYRRDITERVNVEREQVALEAQLRQAQKMELIGHLTGGIAHDFNNILASMLGYAELIHISPDIARNPQLSLYLQEILQAGARAKQLVAQLLCVNQRTEAATESPDIASLVNEVGALLRSTTPTSTAIKTTLGENLPDVSLSSVKLHQILMNLGINARDSIKGKGVIEFKAERVMLDGVKTCAACRQFFSGAHLMISVRDTGSGIEPSILMKMFDPFFTTKEVGRGSGLGMSVVHGIVHSAKGHIDVRTALGEGTDICVYLPAGARQTGQRAAHAGPGAAAARGAGNVMVVDDEASIVGFMSTLLEQSLGCTVTGLTSSTEALRRFQDDPYGVDMVIVDQTMPDLTGAELARAMLAARPDIPIVMNTGYSNTIDEDAAHRIGIRRFLVKPVPARILVDIVAECLGAKSIGDARAKAPTGTA